MVRTAGLEPARPKPTDFHTNYGFHRHAFGASTARLWSGLSLHHNKVKLTNPCRRCCPSSLYTFPILFQGSGLARDWHNLAIEAFPEFEQFYSSGFPKGTQFFKSVVSTNSTTSARVV
ncbi:MAG: hypothetical protein V7776_06885 [Halopseudomonas aestusnigri]